MSNSRNRISNPFLKWILRSPLHGMLSGNMLLITVTGRKSGQRYTTPVGYVRDGDDLLVISQRDRTWWRNLRGGASVRVRVQGCDLSGLGTAIEDQAEVAKNILIMLTRAPQYQKFLAIQLAPDGQPTDPPALDRLAQQALIVRITNLN